MNDLEEQREHALGATRFVGQVLAALHTKATADAEVPPGDSLVFALTAEELAAGMGKRVEFHPLADGGLVITIHEEEDS